MRKVFREKEITAHIVIEKKRIQFKENVKFTLFTGYFYKMLLFFLGNSLCNFLS